MRTRPILVILAMSFVLGLIGCAGNTISDINRDAAYMKGEEVTVRGEVTDVFTSALTGESAYEVKDETGKIWVHRKEMRPPDKGRRVAVSGTLDTNFSLDSRQFSVVIHETTAM